MTEPSKKARKPRNPEFAAMQKVYDLLEAVPVERARVVVDALTKLDVLDRNVLARVGDVLASVDEDVASRVVTWMRSRFAAPVVQRDLPMTETRSDVRAEVLVDGKVPRDVGREGTAVA